MHLPTAASCLVQVLVLFLGVGCIAGYRVVQQGSDVGSGSLNFLPYEQGFVGSYGDPLTTLSRERVNEGVPGTADVPRLYAAPSARQLCPGMVGPFEDGNFYCLSREHGLCDRRTGICACNAGYTGHSCDVCRETHYLSGGLCYPKLICPYECSGGGSCDYETGNCQCLPHRTGPGCEQRVCEALFDPLCRECSAEACLRCHDSFFVGADGGCLPCTLHDPRCTKCDSDQCLACGDILLTSVKRSGQLATNPPLPDDEIGRQLLHKLEFGSQNPAFFLDAEYYRLISGPDPPFLSDTAMGCDQGIDLSSADWTCGAEFVSHLVCGHEGVVTFLSPTYEVPETGEYGSGTIRLTAVRSGGGVGQISFVYSIQHLSTDDKDVSASSQWTSESRILMEDGVVRVSWLLTVHDDAVTEGDESFLVILSDIKGGASLGSQSRAVVWIRDDDQLRADAHMTSFTGAAPFEATAGEAISLQIDSRSASGLTLGVGGEHFVTYIQDEEGLLPSVDGYVVDNEDGTYTATYQVNKSGVYEIIITIARKGGLDGRICKEWSIVPCPAQLPSRVYRTLDLLWGPTSDGNLEYFSATWSGLLLPSFTENYSLIISTDDKSVVRLRVNDALVIDGTLGEGGGRGNILLTSGKLHYISIELRHRTGPCYIQMLWESFSQPLEIVPSANLFYQVELESSPARLNVESGPAAALASDAAGLGLTSAQVGSTAYFTVSPRDAYANQISGDALAWTALGGDVFKATLQLMENVGGGVGPHKIEILGEFIAESALVNFEYDIHITGKYNLSVTHESWLSSGAGEAADIAGSPFWVTGSPSSTSAANTRVSGPGLSGGVAGQDMALYIEARDISDNLRFGGQDDFSVQLYHKSDPLVAIGSVVDEGNGNYSATILPSRAGYSSLHVTMRGAHVAESPYDLLVIPGEAFGPLSEATGTALAVAVATLPNTFQVAVRDDQGNAVWDVEGVILDVTLQSLLPEVSNDIVYGFSEPILGSDLIKSVYTPARSGLHWLNVTIDGGHIQGSPFTVDILGGPSANLSTADGESLYRAVSGVLQIFDIQARDDSGNPSQDADPSDFTVTLSSNDTAEIEAEIEVSIGSAPGIIRVSYNITTAGEFSVNIVDETTGKDILGSPFPLVVYPAAAFAPWSILVNTSQEIAANHGTIVLQAVDLWRNYIFIGGERFVIDWLPAEVRANAPADNSPKQAHTVAIDHNDGTYTVKTDGVAAGDYDMTISIIEKGGLWATYYWTCEFSIAEPEWFTKGPVDYDWGMLSPGIDQPLPPSGVMFPSDLFSVSFEGFVLAPKISDYTFILSSDAGGLVELAVDGNVIFSDFGGETPQFRRARAVNVVLDEGLHDILLRYQHHEGEASVKMEWTWEGRPKEVIPASALFHKRFGLVNPMTIWPAPTVPGSSIAMGDALATAAAGVNQTFHVVTRDLYLNRRWKGGDSVIAYARGPSGVMIHADTSDLGNGTYAIDYHPVIAGYYMLHVVMPVSKLEWSRGYSSAAAATAGNEVMSSPFRLTVLPGNPDPETTYAYGQGLIQSIAGGVGGYSQFTIRSRDMYGNRHLNGTDGIFEVQLESRATPAHHVWGWITYTSEGEYTVTYNATVAGAYDVHIGMRESLNGDESGELVPLNSSPYTLNVIAAKSFARASICEDCSEVLEKTPPVVGQVKYVTVAARDVWGNIALNGDDEWYVQITGASLATSTEFGSGVGRTLPSTRLAVVTNMGNGKYRIPVTAIAPGVHEVSIQLALRIENDSGTKFGGGGLEMTYYGCYPVNCEPVSMEGLHSTAPQINVNWGRSGLRGAKVVRWRGFIKSPVEEDITFKFLAQGGEAMLWIDDILTLSSLDSDGALATFTMQLGLLHRFEVEYRHTGDADKGASCSLYWSSRSIPFQIVPSFYFFPSAMDIASSPFPAIFVE